MEEFGLTFSFVFIVSLVTAGVADAARLLIMTAFAIEEC